MRARQREALAGGDGRELHADGEIECQSKAPRERVATGAMRAANYRIRAPMTLAPARPPHAAARCYALVPCAGVGARAGAAGPKQYAAARPAAAWSAHTLRGAGRGAAAARRCWSCWPRRHAVRARTCRGFDGTAGSRAAAARRARRPCRNGLAELRARGARRDDWVLVHDAARCLVRARMDRSADRRLPRRRGRRPARAAGGRHAEAANATAASRATRRPRATSGRRRRRRCFASACCATRSRAPAPTSPTKPSAIEALRPARRSSCAASLENFKLTYPADFELAERLLRTRA